MTTPQTNEQMMARSLAMQQYESIRKKGIVTWLLWFFLGAFGVHRYYLGDTKQGIFMTIAGLIFWFPGLAWALIDGFFVNKRIREVNTSTWTSAATQNGVPVQPLPESAV